MAAECYANNGSLYSRTAATYVPCNITAVENGGHSSCCAVGDLCMTNGLCMEQANEAKGANHYWRNGCTDKTWNDPACPNFCRGQEEPNHFNAFIFYCFNPKNEFCCTPQGTLEAGVTGRNTSCCDDEDLVFKAKEPFVAGTAVAVLPRVTTSSLSSSTSSSSTSNLLDSTIGSTSTAAAVTTSSSSTSTPTASSESSGMSSGAKAGLGVGIALGFLAILAIIGAVFLRRRKANNHNGAVLLSDSKSDPPPYVTYESAGTARAELDGTMLPAEMRDSSNKISSSNPVAREMGTTTPTKEDIAVQRYT